LNSQPAGITNGPDGNLWFTEQFGNKVGRITTAGSITEFSIPTSNSQPQFIATGADGNLWFAERNSSKIGTITPAGAISEFAGPTSSQPVGITSGPDNNIWFTDFALNAVGRLIPCTGVQQVTVTATATVPGDLRLDCFFIDSGGRGFPFAVGVKPQSSTSTSSSFSCPFDSSLTPAGNTVRVIAADGFQQSPPQELAVTSAPKPPVATIDSPLPGKTFLQYANIPLRGSAKSPQDGELSGSALQWTTNIQPFTWGTVTAGAQEDDGGGAPPACVDVAHLKFFDGKGSYVSTAPSGPANVLFRIRLNKPTCDDVTYTLFVLDPEGDDLGQQSKPGAGTPTGPGCSPVILCITFNIPIGIEDRGAIPEAVCVYAEVTIEGDVVHRARSEDTCMVLRLNTPSPPGEEFV